LHGGSLENCSAISQRLSRILAQKPVSKTTASEPENSRAKALVIPQNPAVGFSTKISSIASATARVGYLITPALLGFVEGGGTWLRDNHTQFNPITGGVYAQETQTWVGGTFGGGLEYMFLPNWSVFVKYDYTKFSDKGTAFVGCTTTCITEKLNLQTALVGVNFRFH
jgi:outer membrane immunogenic protein